ncbi:hypothetical protein [Priestia taiwanensis]|uniref:Uncharacterized protein n=1 Tax=Priestia taiwanensis TaxID=1347902 RepID=A0A917APK0_9BACI|nr:hypothetical protein [Priestia taiwanensis]MBM7362593.1 hypothetical protein [Priestia taiwanensis]GGE63502.1 hypothetical protein GCM10007140_12180 [Priestia taiwanensis]
MKKFAALFFVFVLSLTAIYAPSASAVGDSRADVFAKGDSLYNTIKVTKALHNSPADPTIVNYVSPVQDVKVLRAYFLVNTWKGHKWIRVIGEKDPFLSFGKDGNWNTLKDFNASNATLKLHMPFSITDGYNDSVRVGSLQPQTVDVRQAWYVIETWLGNKFIGYQLR